MSTGPVIRSALRVASARRRDFARDFSTQIQKKTMSTQAPTLNIANEMSMSARPGPMSTHPSLAYSSQKGWTSGSFIIPGCGLLGCGVGMVMCESGKHNQAEHYPTEDKKAEFRRKNSWGHTGNTNWTTTHGNPAWKRDTFNPMGVTPNQLGYTGQK